MGKEKTMKVSLSDAHMSPATSSEATSSSASTEAGGSVAAFNVRRGKPSWQQEIVDALCRLIELSDDWDTYGGKPLRHDTAMFALQVLNSLMTPAMPTPNVVPIGNGGVQIEWHQNSLDIELYVAAPYECELLVNDQISGESRVSSLSSDFSTLAEALKRLISYNRHLGQVAHAG
jgi:hypothetical protein